MRSGPRVRNACKTRVGSHWMQPYPGRSVALQKEMPKGLQRNTQALCFEGPLTAPEKEQRAADTSPTGDLPTHLPRTEQSTPAHMGTTQGEIPIRSRRPASKRKSPAESIDIASQAPPKEEQKTATKK